MLELDGSVDKASNPDVTIIEDGEEKGTNFLFSSRNKSQILAADKCNSDIARLIERLNISSVTICNNGISGLSSLLNILGFHKLFWIDVASFHNLLPYSHYQISHALNYNLGSKNSSIFWVLNMNSHKCINLPTQCDAHARALEEEQQK
ncbi:hypothetical protein HZS_2341 [Henneguya salminicola]|nr:hypothetical protein HZS_2341 [Henneguya salminicola]